ncbi:MAG TPA: glycoside hydrolase family 97 protein, partial [Pricia sp.]|nr:glycoside hydrolase family 97 protein [Pricia sp.]
SELSLSFKDTGNFGEGLTMQRPSFQKVDENYELIIGKASKIRNHYNEMTVPLVEPNGAKRKVNLVVRLFNDGIGFRHEFPKQKQWQSYVMTNENSSFNLVQNPTVYTLFRENYNTSHEGLYSILPYDQITNDTLMDMPALFEFPDMTYMAITEANLRDYAGMYLKKHEGVLISQLSPLQGQEEIKVKAELPHRTPWRVLLIGNKIGTLIESNIITNLNEPSPIADISWIKPGKTTFHWWNGDILPDSTIVPGVNFETNKYYIDFAARNHIDYHAVIGYGGFAWYTSDAAGYGVVGPNTDVTQPVASLDMQKVCDYAKEKGVDINVWVNWKAIYPDLEKNFAQFEKWGVKGMMVDFMDRDDQEMVNIQEEILRKAAEHHLYIQFHGSFKPTGLQRTYPNEFTREGTHNYEQNKWSEKPISPEHDLNIVFTRMLAGASDYHLGGFRAVPENEFKRQYTRPLMGGTRCHMLAMYVVLESYLNMVADYPDAYIGEHGFDFLKNVPTVWDETIVPNAEVGKFVTIARRDGEDWYMGSLNNSEPRTIEIPLNFLSEGSYKALIYSDAPDVLENPNHLVKTTRIVTKKDTMKVELAGGGGQAIQFVKM